MKFVKLRLTVPDGHGGRKDVEEWRCVISQVHDLLLFANFEAELFARAFLQLERMKNGSFEAAHAQDKKVGALATMLNLRRNRLKEGETFDPLIETVNIHDRKIKGMMKVLELGQTLCVHQNGSFCDLESFLSIWNGEIIATIEKDEQGFPVEIDVLKSVTLILENQDRPHSKLVDIVSKRTESKPGIITNLKEKDSGWVIKSMMNANTLAFSSTFRDQKQVIDFLNVFGKMPRKHIIIGYFGEDVKKLTDHPSYNEVASKHSVELIDLTKI